MAEPSAASRSIWLWAFGYFASYAPYAALTKALSTGALGAKISGSAILPLATFASVAGMPIFLLGTGWWRSASRFKLGSLSLPGPTRWTLLSGLCCAAIITTTTLSYAFEGVSIVLMMLLMRGGVLACAPVVDKLTGRKILWHNWLALGLTLASLLVATGNLGSRKLTIFAIINVIAYVTAYFVRLRFMSRLAKAESEDASRKFFVEEQLVAAPTALLALIMLAVIGEGSTLAQIRSGFTEVPFSSQMPIVMGLGFCSLGTGIFGALVLLDKRSNSFTVPVNRASSVLAGVIATVGLAFWLGLPQISGRESLGAVLVTAAIVVLSVPALLKPAPVPAKPG